MRVISYTRFFWKYIFILKISTIFENSWSAHTYVTDLRYQVLLNYGTIFPKTLIYENNEILTKNFNSFVKLSIDVEWWLVFILFFDFYDHFWFYFLQFLKS